MRRLPESSLNIQDVPRLFSRYWASIALSALVGSALFTVIAFEMPKKYKSHFVLTISSKYFQSPLIGDFVPELGESGEMRSQRESLILQVITPDYLDALAQKYGIYSEDGTTSEPLSRIDRIIQKLHHLAQTLGLVQSVSTESRLSNEREMLRARIDIFSTNSTTFNVGFIYSDPGVTFDVTKDLYTQIIQALLSVRMGILANVRDAIQKRVDMLSGSIQGPAVVEPAPAAGSQVLQDQLNDVHRQLHTLQTQYTDEHPLVIQMKEKEQSLEQQVAAAINYERQDGHSRSHDGGGSADSGGRESARDIYGDLLKKLNYLNIAIDSDRDHQGDYFATLETPLYPSSPLWPKKAVMSAWGFALGLVSSLFIVALREYFDRSRLHASSLAHQLGISLIGGLPKFPPKTKDLPPPGQRPYLPGR